MDENNKKRENQVEYKDNSSTGALSSLIFTIIVVVIMYLLSKFMGN